MLQHRMSRNLWRMVCTCILLTTQLVQTVGQEQFLAGPWWEPEVLPVAAAPWRVAWARCYGLLDLLDRTTPCFEARIMQHPIIPCTMYLLTCIGASMSCMGSQLSPPQHSVKDDADAWSSPSVVIVILLVVVVLRRRSCRSSRSCHSHRSHCNWQWQWQRQWEW